MQTISVLITLLFLLLAVILTVVLIVRKIMRKPGAHLGTVILILLISSFLLLILTFGSASSPKTTMLLLGLLALPVGIILLIVSLIISAVKKQKKPKLRNTGIILAVLGILLFIVSASDKVSVGMILTGVLLILAAIVLLVVNLVLLILKKKPKKLFIADSAVLAAGVILMVSSNLVINAESAKMRAAGEIEQLDIQVDYDFEVKDGDTPVEIKLTNGFEDRPEVNSLGTRLTYRYVYDASKDGLLLDVTDVTPEMCVDVIKSSDTIPEKYKSFFIDIVQRIGEQYPDADLAVLYKNLASLHVEEVDSTGMLMKTFSASAYACYVMTENTIYLPEGADFTEVQGNFDFQSLVHEFCHACRTSWYDEDDYKNRFEFDSDWESNTLLMEAMNSAFSCSLLNFYEPDIAYQMPSNYLRIMLECMDNYDLSDYMNHSDMYFLKKLDEYSGYTNYAQVIWKLITLQRSDWEEDDIDLSSEKYEPIYDYLCELYYGKYLTDDMTDEEAYALADELAEKAGFDCPEGYKFEEDYFTEYMEKLREG